MSSLDQVRQAVVQKIYSSGFFAQFPDVKLQLPNQAFAVPESLAYVKLSIVHGDSDPAQIGKTVEIDRSVGFIQFDVVIPLDVGTKNQNDIADYLGKVFRRLQLPTTSAGTLNFRTPNLLTSGQERGADKLILRIPFRRDEYFRNE